MSPAYRILKLNSGDEIIARIQKRHKGKVYMETPMCFKTVLMSDPMTGIQREITILKDWVSYSNDKFIKIPEDIVVSYTKPMDEAVSLYEKEKEKKLKTKKREIKNMDTFNKEMKNDVQKFLDDIMNQVESVDPVDMEGDTLDDIYDQIRALGPNQKEGYEFDIEFTFSSEEISDETTEKDTNHPDYGNRWTDWSSDPRNY